jgi:Domain of unknown function (DUF4440)
MKKIIIVVLAFFSAGIVFSQDADKYGATPVDIKALQELNEQHANAFATGNSAILNDKILADDFILISNNGKVYRKPEVIQQVVDSKASVQNIVSHTLENVIIRFVAPGVSMVHARIKFKMKDGTITNGVQYNDIYAMRNGRWICVSGNNTPVAAPLK